MTFANLEIQNIFDEQVFWWILHLFQDSGEEKETSRPGILVIQKFPTSGERLARRRHQPPLPPALLIKLKRQVLDIDTGNFEMREIVLVAGVGDAVDIEGGYDVGFNFTLLQSVMLKVKKKKG